MSPSGLRGAVPTHPEASQLFKELPFSKSLSQHLSVSAASSGNTQTPLTMKNVKKKSRYDISCRLIQMWI